MKHESTNKASDIIVKTAYDGACQALEDLNNTLWINIHAITKMTLSTWARDNEELMRNENWERYARLKDRLHKKQLALIGLSGEIDEYRTTLREQYLKEIGVI